MTVRAAWTPEKVRQRIRTGVLLRRLMDHVLGKVEMSPTQITAAQTLLRKSLPDLSAVEHSGNIAVLDAAEMTDAELTDIATASRAGTAETPVRPPEPDAVH